MRVEGSSRVDSHFQLRQVDHVGLFKPKDLECDFDCEHLLNFMGLFPPLLLKQPAKQLNFLLNNCSVVQLLLNVV